MPQQKLFAIGLNRKYSSLKIDMADEIERKFLIHEDKIDLSEYPVSQISQGYLISGYDPTIRVRVMGCTAFLTIKTPNKGVTREEFEYEIPFRDGIRLMDLCEDRTLSKYRFQVDRWEVDVFFGSNTGLVIAEIELTHVHEEFDLPEWAGEEVSHDSKYYNINLINHPFSNWDK